MADHTLQSLKELVLDDDFSRLQNLSTKEINLMDILKVSHKELQHSNFLAWLFNPSENHGLRDYALKEFIKLYYKDNQFQDLGKKSGISVFDFINLNFDDLVIKREYKNIDLIFLSKQCELCIVIENKIRSGEHSGQLTKYRETIETEYPDSTFKHKIYIFLSLEEQEISPDEQEHYIQLTYTHIIKLLEQIQANKQLSIATETAFIFEQYLRTLKSMLNQNEEIENLARTLYLKYKPAFDLVAKYTNDHRRLIGTRLSELIQNHSAISPFHSNNTYIRFQPLYFRDNIDKLKNSGILNPSTVNNPDALNDNRLFLFEFKIRRSRVIFCFKIGKGEQEHREKLYSLYAKNTKLFNKLIKKSGKMSPVWHQAFQKEILKTSEIEQYHEDGNINELYKKLEDRFNDLMNHDIRNILEFIDKEID